MGDLKRGDKFLLPVTYEKPGVTSQFFLTQTGYHILFDHPEIASLIPASRLTDLEAENAKLQEALYGEVGIFNTGDNQ